MLPAVDRCVCFVAYNLAAIVMQDYLPFTLIFHGRKATRSLQGMKQFYNQDELQPNKLYQATILFKHYCFILIHKNPVIENKL